MDQMRSQLKQMARSDDIPAMVSLLAGSAEFEEDLQLERGQLQERIDTLARKASSKLKKLSRSNSFKDITEGLMLYDSYPEETKPHYEALQAVWTGMQESATARLKEISTGDNPEVLRRELLRFDDYQDMCEEYAVVDSRRKTLLKEARQKTAALAKNPKAKLSEMAVMLEKFESYPDDDGMGSARDCLEKRIRSETMSVTTKLARLEAETDPGKIEAALEEYGMLRMPEIAPAVEGLRKRLTGLNTAMREKMQQALSSEDLLVLAEVLFEAKPFGEGMAQWVAAIEKRQTKLLDDAREAIAGALRSENFEMVTTALTKYTDFSPDTESLFRELGEHWESLLTRAQDRLREQTASSDPRTIQRTLRDFERGPIVEAAAGEIAAVKTRLKELIMDANSKMESLASALNENVDLKDMELAIAKYRHYPGEEVGPATEKLKARIRAAVESSGDEIVLVLRGSDIEQVERLLEKWSKAGSGADRMGDSMNKLREHRRTLYEKVKKRLAAAADSDSPVEVENSLKEAEPYGKEVASERRVLQRKRTLLSKSVGKELQELRKSDDYAEVKLALKRYEEGCPSEAKPQWDALEQHAEELLDNARQALRAISNAESPVEIDDSLRLYSGGAYGDAVDVEAADARKRRKQLVDDAIKDMQQIVDDPDVTLSAMTLALERFEKFPADVRKARDAIKTKQAVTATKVRDLLTKTARSEDVLEVDQVLEEHKQDGEKVKQAYESLQKHRRNMQEVMERRLANMLAEEDPTKIQKVIDDSDQYGDSMSSARKELQHHLTDMLGDAKGDLMKMTRSPEFVKVTATLKKYEDYSDVKTTWDGLQKHWTGLIETAKTAALKLCSAELPQEIDEGLLELAMYSEPEEHIKDEKLAALTRRKELLDMAKAELVRVFEDKGSDIATIAETLQKYEPYPDDVARQRRQLTAKFTAAKRDAEVAMRSAAARGDIEALDAAMAVSKDSEKELASVLAESKKARKQLIDKMFDKISVVMSSSTPTEIIDVLAEAEPYLTDPLTADAENKLRKHLQDMQEKALTKLKDASESKDPIEIEGLLSEYAPFDEDPDVGVQLVQARQHLETVVSEMQEKLRQAASSTSMVDMKEAMEESKNFGRRVHQERAALERKLMSNVKGIKRELQDLMRSSDVQSITKALETFEDHPDDVHVYYTSLQEHWERTLDKAKDKLLTLCSATEPRTIKNEIARYDQYEDHVKVERDAAQERLSDLIQTAKVEMEQICKTESATVLEMEQLLVLYGDYPREELKEARKALDAKIDEMTSAGLAELRTLLATDVISEIDAGLETFTNAGSRFQDIIADVRDHRKDLVDDMRTKLKRAASAAKPDAAAIASLLGAAESMGRDVLAERKALERRRGALTRDILREMSSVMHSDDYEEVKKLVNLYEDYSPETSTQWTMLNQHLDSIVETAKGDLIEACQETDPITIKDAMLAAKGFGQDVQDELNRAGERIQQLVDEAIVKLEAMAKNESALIPDMEEELKFYAEYPSECRRARDALKTKLVLRSTKIREQITAALRSSDIKVVDEVLTQNSMHHGQRLGDALDTLKRHRDRLRDTVTEKLRQAMNLDDPRKIALVLTESESFLPAQESDDKKKPKKKEVKKAKKADDKKLKRLQKVQEDSEGILKQKTTKHERLKGEKKAKKKKDVEKQEAAIVKAGADRASHQEKVDVAKAAVEAEQKAQDAAELDTGSNLLSAADARKEQAASAAGDREIVAARRALERRYDMLLRNINAELKRLVGSDDYPAIASAVGRYEGYPEQVDLNRKLCEDVAAEQVTAAKTRLSEVLQSSDPNEMSLALKRFEGYGKPIEKERNAAKDHRGELIASARASMERTLNDDEATLKDLANKAKEFEDYPDEVSRVRKQLKKKLDGAIRSGNSKLKNAMALHSVKEVDETLEEYGASKEFLMDSLAELTRHRRILKENMGTSLRKALSNSDIGYVDSLLTQAEEYGDSLSAETKALGEHRKKVLKSVMKEIEQLSKSEDFSAVVAAVKKFESFPDDVKPKWEGLQAHQDQLLEATKETLTKILASDSPHDVQRCLDEYESYSKMTVRERTAAQVHYDGVIAKAKDDMQSAFNDDESSLGLLDRLLVKYNEFPLVEQYLDKVRRKLALGRDLAEDDYRDCLIAEDVVLVDSFLIKYADAGLAMAEQVAMVEDHRKQIQASVLEAVTIARDSSDPRIVRETLDSAQHFLDDAQLKDPIDKLKARLSELQSKVLKEIGSALQSATPEEVLPILAEAEQFEGDPSAQDAVNSLRRHVKGLAEDMRSKLRAARASDSPSEIDAMLIEAKIFGDEVERETRRLQDRRVMVVESAISEMERLLESQDFVAVKDVIERFARYPDAVKPAWEKLQEHWDNLVDDAKEALRELRHSEDPRDIAKEMTRFEAYRDNVEAQAAAVWERHAELIAVAREKISDLIAQGDASEMKDLGDMVDSYQGFPDELDAVRKQLHDLLKNKVKTATDELRKLLLSPEIKLVDAAIEKYAETGHHLLEPMTRLRKHRKDLVDRLRNKMRVALGSQDLRHIRSLVNESDDFGDELLRWRKALVERATLGEAKLVDNVQTLKDSADFKAVGHFLVQSAVMPDQVKEHIEALQQHHDDMLAGAKAELKALAESEDARLVSSGLKKYEKYGDVVVDERKAARQRLDQLVQLTRDDLATLVQEEKDLVKLSAAIDKYTHFPVDVTTMIKLLKEKQYSCIREATLELKRTTKSQNVGDIDVVIDKYAPAADHVRPALEVLRRHRQNIQDSIFFRLKSALSYDDPRDIDEVLHDAEPFGEGVNAEKTELQTHRENTIEKAVEHMKQICSTETAFEEVENATERYASYPPAARAQFDLLQLHRDELVSKAKGRLIRLCDESNPNLIQEEMATLKAYGTAVLDERDSAHQRWVELLDAAREDMDDCLTDPKAAISDMATCLKTYAEYPEEVKRVSGQLKEKLRSSIRTAREMLMISSNSGSIVEVDSTLEMYSEAAAHLREPFTALQNYKIKLQAQMRAQLRESLEQSDPKTLAKTLEASKVFGDELDADRERLRQHMGTMIEAVIERLNELCESDEYDTIAKTIAVYDDYPQETKLQWATPLQDLRKRADGLVDQAKTELRQMRMSNGPKEIQAALSLFPEMGDKLHLEREALQDRVADLLFSGKENMRSATNDPSATLAHIGQVLEHYRDYPSQVAETRQRLEDRMDDMVLTADMKLRTYLRSTDVAAINDALAEHAVIAGYLKDAISVLNIHLQDLADEMTEEVHDALGKDDLLTLDDLLKRIEPYGSTLQQEHEQLNDWREAVLDTTLNELQALTSSTDFRAISASIIKYSGESWPELVEDEHDRLVEQQKVLIQAARNKIAELCQSPDPQIITTDLAMLSQSGYDSHVSEERSACLGHWSALIDSARAEMHHWIESPEIDNCVSEVADTIAKYESFPEDVLRIRRKLQKRLTSAIRTGEKQLKQHVGSGSITDCNHVLEQWKTAGEHVADARDLLVNYKQSLIDDMKARMATAMALEDPAQVFSVLIRSEPFEADVKVEHRELEIRHSTLLENSREELVALLAASDYQEVTQSLAKYRGEGYADVLEHWKALRVHQDELVLDAQASLRKLVTKMDVELITSEMAKYESFGPTVRAEMDALENRMFKLSESARTTMQRLLVRKNATEEEIAECIEKYEAYPETLTKTTALLREKLGSLQQLKKRLDAICSTIHPADIENELARFETTYGPAIADQCAALRTRLGELVNTARDSLQAIIDMEAPPLHEMEHALDTYRDFPPDIQALRLVVQRKFGFTLQQAKRSLTLLLSSEGIVEIDAAIRHSSQTGQHLAMQLAALQKHRLDLCEAQSVKMRTAIALYDPNEISEIMRASVACGADVDNEMRALRIRFNSLLSEADTTLMGLMNSGNAVAIDAALARYEHFPEEVHNGSWNELKSYKRELKDEVVQRVEDLMQSFDLHDIEATLTQILEEFGPDMRPFSEMLRARRARLLRHANGRMREALLSSDIGTIDKIFVESLPLVEDIDEGLWAKLRLHRERVLGVARDAIAESLGNVDLVKVEQLLASIAGVVMEMDEERAELSEYREYLLEESEIEKAGVDEVLNDPHAGFTAVAAKLRRINMFGDSAKRESASLQQVLAGMVVEAKQEMIEAAESSDAKRIARVLDKYRPYGETVSNQFEALEICLSRLRESCKHDLLQALDEEDSPLELQIVLQSSSQFEEELKEERRRVMNLHGRLMQQAVEELQAVLTAKPLHIDGAKTVLDKYRDLGGQPGALWLELNSAVAGAVTVARKDVLSALGGTDAMVVLETLSQYKHESLETMHGDIEALELHFRRLIADEQQRLKQLMSSTDMMAVRAHAETQADNPFFEREVAALMRRYRKLAADFREHVAVMSVGFNVVHIAQFMEQSAAILKHEDFEDERSKLQQRSRTLHAKLARMGIASAVAADVGGEALDADRKRSVEAAREHMTRLLSSADVFQIDAALKRYSYLGDDVDDVVQKLQTRRVVVSTAPRSDDYSTIMTTSLTSTHMEVLNQTARERLRVEVSRQEAIEVKAERERQLGDELEREVSALRQSIRYRRQIQQAENAQFGAGQTSSVARAVEEYRPCVVCKHRVLAAEWRAHCGKCIVDVVRHSVMASSGERLDSSIGGSPKRAQAATTMR